MTQPAASKEHLYLFVMLFSEAVLLLDMLKPTRPIRRGMALGISTADEIKRKIDTANEIEQAAMVYVSRKHLATMRGLVMAGVFPITAMKSRKEWIEASRKLIKETEKVGVFNGNS